MKQYQIVNTESKLKKLRDKMMQLDEFAFDVETNTLRVNGENSEYRLVGISISWGDYNNYYIPVGHRRFEDRKNNAPLPLVVKYLRPVFGREDVRIIAHNYKFDRHALERIGIHINTEDIFDTLIASWLCNENNDKGLKPNALFRLLVKMVEFNEVIKIDKEIKKQFGLKGNQKATFDLTLIKDGAPYALADAYYTWKLYVGYVQELADEGMEDIYYKKYTKFLDCLYVMEERGVEVDQEKLTALQKEITIDCDNLLYQMFELVGKEFNPNSSQQKAEVMFGFVKQDYMTKKGKLMKANPNHDLIALNFGFKPLTYTDTGIPQANADVLFKILRSYRNKQPRDKRKREGLEFAKLLYEYSGINKLKTAFIDGSAEQMYDDGKVHPNFNIVGCLVSDTLIPTTKGLYPIGNIKSNLKDNVAEEVELNIVNKNLEVESTKYLVKFNNVPTVSLTTNLGFTLEGSHIHPIMCNKYHPVKNSHRYLKHRDNKDECRVWKKLEDVKVGDMVEIPVGYNVFSDSYVTLTYDEVKTKYNHKEVNLPNILNEDLSEFLGMYYADGSLHDGNGSFSIRITNGNSDVVNRVCELSESLFNVKSTLEYKDNSVTTIITAKHLSPIEKSLEMKRGCVNKTIPDIILKSPRNVITSFIKGMTLDSCVVTADKKQLLKFTVSNEISAKYLQEILLNFGIVSSRRQDTSKTNNVFYVFIYNSELLKFLDIVGFVEKCKTESIKSEFKSISPNYTRIDNTLWLRVKEINEGVNDVYDFNVPESHSFISGAFISHNTDSGRISCIAEDTKIEVVGGRKSIQDIKKGELVYCYDDSGNLRISEVLNVIDNGYKECVSVKWSSQGTHKSGELICTPEHKVRTQDGKWVRADSLTGQRVTHLRRSNEKRPRLYGLKGFVTREQEFIKTEYFKASKKEHIHHKDLNPSNNSIENLDIMTHEDHTRYHNKLMLEDGRLKYKHLYDGSCKRPEPLKGEDHPMYFKMTKEELENLVIQYQGRISDIPMDFDTFKKKCKEVDYDYKITASKFQKQYVEVTKDEFIDSYIRNKGKKSRIQKELGIGRVKCDKLIEQYDCCYNHHVNEVSKLEDKHHVYDLEVKDYHNFIASEICVHNCSNPNLQQLPNAEEESKYQVRDLYIGSLAKSGKRKMLISAD